MECIKMSLKQTPHSSIDTSAKALNERMMIALRTELTSAKREVFRSRVTDTAILATGITDTIHRMNEAFFIKNVASRRQA